VVDLVTLAIPVLLLCLALEWASYRFLPDDDELGYDVRDAATSVSMGVGSTLFDGAMKAAAVVTFAAVFTVSPWQLSASSPLTWVLLFFADDLAYYWFHRAHHEVRVLWASHVVHHSSRFFNLSTALRQSWTPMTIYPFWLPLALFFPPWMILAQQSVSLIYQFFLHTERIDKMWRPVEAVLNTPSHHRVHHGSNDVYLDRNYGGILIIWDRMFGTYEPEGERVKYGLTKNIGTFNPVRAAFHEYIAMWHDIKRTPGLRNRLGIIFHGPGWVPPGTHAAEMESNSRG
jgi:sterol desaturase/sphingolipid hydroxylase (fatty acid hydroxylase superfamily)